jgi:class 3 adenylate cyclase/predicted ATPase
VDIGAWLRELGLGRYVQAFQDNEVDARSLPHLTAEDLKEMGVTAIGHRRLLLQVIADLQESGASAVEPASEHITSGEGVNDAGKRPSEAERRQLTVLFCDLVGSTALSARLDPEDMGHVIGTYQKCCTEVVKRWGGHLARYLGDGALAYFGFPQAHEDDAERAVRAGLELVAAVARLEARDGAPLAARVGIATGLIMVSELIGEGAAKEQTVVGETPNLAARLQALATPGSVVISQATHRLVGALFELADLGAQRLKGFGGPVRAWRVEGAGRAEGRFEALHGRHLIPLVGREEELHLLLARWRRAAEGEGQVVLLSGEPGIGKSRIVQALREQLAGQPYTPLSYYCSPYHTASALYPVIGLLERAAGFTRDDPPEARLDKLEALLAQGTERLAETVPLIADVLGIAAGDRYPSPNLSPQRKAQRTLEVLVEQVEGLASRQPVLALYEDAHWIDPTTLAALGLLIERVQRLRVLVLITFRPEFVAPWSGHAHVTQLSLPHLTRRHGATIVTRLAADKALPEEILNEIVARTDGIPLFVEELTKAVLESGLLQEAGDHYEMAGPLPPLAIPSTLQDSLMARLDRLGPVKEVAQIGAVIGRDFDYQLLAAVFSSPEKRLNDALDRLVESALVFRRGAPPDATYTFKHVLVQEAAYNSLLSSRRQELHARIAQALEEQFPGVAANRPEVLARHFTDAELTEQAVRYWYRAGQQAAERFAHKEAIAHLRKGVEVLEKLPNSSARDQQELDLQIALGSPLIVTMGYAAPEVEQAYLRAQKLSRRVGDVSQLFTATWGLWILNLTRMRLKSARGLADELLSLARRQADPAYLLQARHAAWTTCLHLPELSACAEQAEQGVVLYDRDQYRSHKFLYGGHDPGVCAGNHRALSRWLLGFPDQAVVQAEEAVALARDLAHSFSLILALTFFSFVCHFRRDLGLAREHAQSAATVCTEQGIAPQYLAIAGIVRGWAEVHETRAMQGIAEIQHALDQLEAMRVRQRRSYYLAILAEAYGSVGEPEQGLGALTKAEAFMEETGEGLWEAEIHRLKGELLLHRSSEGQVQVEASFQKALNTARRQESRSLELRAAASLARLWADQDKRAEAYDLLAPVYGWFTEGFDTADLKNAKALLDELR